MKNNVRVRIKYVFLFVCCALLVLSCDPGSGDPTPTPEPSATSGSPSGILADSYFWGTWVRMDNGAEYQFKEREVVYKGGTYYNSSGSESYLNVRNLGTFQKQSESVMLVDAIPLFRKGGADLEYSVKLVGFLGGSSRAAGNSSDGEESLANYTVTGTTEGFPSSENEAVSDSNGEAKLIAKRPGEQTVKVTSGDKEQTTHGLNVTRNGANVGKIVVAGENGVSLKVTVPQLENQTYFYAGKNYQNLGIVIENTGSADCGTSHVILSSNNSAVTLSGQTDFWTSTLKPGVQKNDKSFNLQIGSFSEPYIDVEINVNIYIGDKEWDDVISFRAFRGQMPITISAKSIEGNQNARLKGFLIYPDKNHKYFSIANNSSAKLYVPTFSKNYGDEFMMVFCGAATATSLKDSTEMHYSVAFDTETPRTIVTTGIEANQYMNYGETLGGNDTENSAYDIQDETSFQAVLHNKDIDYYKIKVESNSTKYYGAESIYNLSVDRCSYNEAVLSWDLASGIIDNNVSLYKDGELVASGVSSPYTVKNLSESTSYSFILKNADGDEISSAVTAKTTEKPSLVLSCTSFSSRTAELKVVNNKNTSGTFYLYENGYYGNVSKSFSGYGSTTFTVTGLSRSTTYKFVLKTSSSSAADEISNVISVTTLAAEPVLGKPSVTVSEVTTDLQGIKEFAYSYYGGDVYNCYPSWVSVALAWTAATGAERYKIYRYCTTSSSDYTASQIMSYGSAVATVSSLKYTDSGINGRSVDYVVHYVVVPVDEAGAEQRSMCSTPFWVSTDGSYWNSDYE